MMKMKKMMNSITNTEIMQHRAPMSLYSPVCHLAGEYLGLPPQRFLDVLTEGVCDHNEKNIWNSTGRY